MELKRTCVKVILGALLLGDVAATALGGSEMAAARTTERTEVAARANGVTGGLDLPDTTH